MKSPIKYAAVGSLCVCSISPLFGAPAVVLGDDATLFVNSSVAYEHQSNIVRSPTNEISDSIMVITPGIEVKMGGNGSTLAQFRAGMEFRQHFKEDSLNGEYARLSFGSLYDSGILLIRTYAGYNEFGTNSRFFNDESGEVDLLQAAERSDLTAGVSARYSLSETISLGAGADYMQRDWDDQSMLTGFESLAIPVQVYFAVAPELDAFVGYRYRTVESDGGSSVPSYDDSYIYAGLEGEVFNPLWTARVDVGFQERTYDGSNLDGDSTDGISFSAKLNYAADANRNYYAILGRDYGVSTRNAISYERTRLTLGGDYRVTEMWSTFAGITLSEADYDRDPADLLAAPRKEHVVMGRIGVSYIPNEYVTISGSYQYIDVNLDNAFLDRTPGSEVPNPGYDNTVISVTASLRY